MSDRGGGSGDLGEETGDRYTRLRLPVLDLRPNRVVSVVDHGADLSRMRECEDEVELIVS